MTSAVHETVAAAGLASGRLVSGALALTAWLAVWTLGTLQSNPVAAAETTYLATVAAPVLLGLALLVGRDRTGFGAACVAITATAWILPTGTVRAASFTGILVLSFGLLLARRLRRDGASLPFSAHLGSALAAQAIARSKQLLGFELVSQWPEFIALPLVAAASLYWLTRKQPAERVLVLGGTLLVLGSGWSFPGISTLLTLAAWEHCRTAGPNHSVLGRLPWIVLFATPTVALWLRPELGASLAVLLLGLGLRQVARPAKTGRAATLTALIGATTLLGLWLGRGSDSLHPVASLDHVSQLVFLLPSALLSLLFGRPLAAMAIAGAAVIGGLGGAIELLAPIVALAVWATPNRPSLEGVQQSWTAALLAGTGVLTGYPWFRVDGIDPLVAGAGWKLTVSGLLAGALPLLVIFAAAATVPWTRKARVARTATSLWIVWLLVSTLEPVNNSTLLGSVQLHSGKRHRNFRLPPESHPKRLILESRLSNGYALEPGTTVARIVTRSPEKDRFVRRLRIGEQVGEWAAERPDVAALYPSENAAVWSYWVAPEGRFFGHRYRAEWTLDGETELSSIGIALPREASDLVLNVDRLEVIE